jgi:hypothetical protein
MPWDIVTSAVKQSNRRELLLMDWEAQPVSRDDGTLLSKAQGNDFVHGAIERTTV